MSDESLIAVLTTVFAAAAASIGAWLGLRLVKRADPKHNQSRLTKITMGIWITGALALSAWILSGGQLRFGDVVFAFVIVSIAIFAAFSRKKGA